MAPERGWGCPLCAGFLLPLVGETPGLAFLGLCFPTCEMDVAIPYPLC